MSLLKSRWSLGLLLGLGAVACGGGVDEVGPEFTVDAATHVDAAAVITGDAGQAGPSGSTDAGPTSALDASPGADASSSGRDAAVASGDAGAAADTGTGPQADASASADSGSDAGAAGADAGPPAKPKCVKKDSQVMVIGDSFINWISHKFPEQLKTVTMQNWRMLAVGGTSMGSGGIGRIPDQFYDDIKADPDAHTVLMDGGGNDVLVPDLGLDPFGVCRDVGSSTNPNCNMIIKLALDAAGMLMDRAAAAGIRDVVYFFYPHIPDGRLIGGPHPNEILDHSVPMVESFCNGAEARTKGKLRCHFINMVPLYEGHIPGVNGLMAGAEADWFNDDIHPNEKGSQAMVNKVWEVMQAKCIGQKDKDCCEK